jgi:AcrR family transcriptional regulator
MADDVNSRRRYRSPLRAGRAADTRRRIVGAASELFVERGYSGTTVEAIAQRASVSLPTVYGAVGNKARLLAESVRLAVRGGPGDEPLLEQEGPRAVREASDQRTQLRLFATDAAERLERVSPLMEVVTAAARVEPEIAALHARFLRSRLESHRALIGWLAANGPLRGGLGLDEAAELSWALVSPEMHRLLRRERRWSKRRFAAWIETTLARQLLDEGPSR